jgi:hypothetical protein
LTFPPFPLQQPHGAASNTHSTPMLKSAFTVGIWTMASRILGFARDILIAAILGTDPVADAFFVAPRGGFRPALFS